MLTRTFSGIRWLVILGLLLTAMGVMPAAVSQAQCRPRNEWATYVVVRGDTLSRIARRFGTTVAALTGGMGVLKVGTNSKLATDLRKSQAERAFKVLSSIQRTGVVAGGGAALVHCIPAVRQAAAAEPDEDIRNGMQVLAAALDAPMRRLLHNAGLRPPSVAIAKVAEAGAPATYNLAGGDVERGAVADAFAAGVVDAAGVVEAILQTAVSGASMALSTDAIVYHRNPPQATQP
jgi:chaperonin GroEL